ncbi:MAG: metallophosphoesterase [bacterium]
MKIGIISDSHDNVDLFEKGIDFFNAQGVSLVLHAGDLVSPFTFTHLRKLKCPCVMIFGNNEGEKVALTRLAEEAGVSLNPGPYEYKFQNKDILLMHEPYTLRSASVSGCYDLVVYGHTHLPDVKTVKGCLVVNPGECCGYVTGEATLAVVELQDMSVKIYSIPDFREKKIKEVF